jgi:neutral ceramidase
MDRRAFLTASGAVVLAGALPRAAQWRAGVARTDITPRTSLWMAGFAARTRPSQGTALPLHAKALALDDGRGRPAVLVTLDLLGVTGAMSSRIASAVERRHRVSRDRLLLSTSHTHCGPVVDDMLHVAYALDEPMRGRIAAYTGELETAVVDTVGKALAALQPASLGYAVDEAGFAANRRTQFTPDGPVDRRAPVLRVAAASGQVLAIVFGYACHNTTLPADFVEFHGDYAGVAQAELEKRHPGTCAMYVAGCGADANPRPRGTAALVEQHGTALADAVDRALPRVEPIAASLRTKYREVELPFARVPGADEWRVKTADKDQYVARHARSMLALLENGGRISAFQRDPVQVWRLGSLTLVALGGEVVVDYALRLAREHGGKGELWVAGYSNDVFGYVPSRRVLDEGGYEGGGAMIYYGKPGPFDGTVEERIVKSVKQMW